MAQRRADDDHLVRVYHAALVEAGVRDYSLKMLRRHTKLGFFRGFLAVISASVHANFASERGRQLLTARIERNIAVLVDHDVGEVLS